ncbi:hypothetical protein D3C76_973970 [compost metagenome]
MLWPRIQLRITSSTTNTPGVRNTCMAAGRLPAACPGYSGTERSTHTTSSNATRVTTTNVARQPSPAPSQVAIGSPSDKAIGCPSMANAMARPCCAAGTIRRAWPAIRPQASPAAAPVKKRSTRVRLLDVDKAVSPLNSTKPMIASSRARRRYQPWVRVTSGIAVSSEPRA